MRHLVEIAEAGLANLVQDAGRMGHRAIGVPVSGAADGVLLACANRLVGNVGNEAGMEMPLAGPTLRAPDGPVRLALVGEVDARLLRADGQVQRIAAAHSVTLRRGDSLRIGSIRAGVAYLALSGGCRVPAVLGSRSTYVRAALGGVHGRSLQAGDLIDCGPPTGNPALESRAAAFAHREGPIRVMLGPQDDAFEPQAIETLLRETYRVSRDSDRMGMRLEGPALAHRQGADITSEGVVPGAIQVPGNGLPIVLLADAQTIGGYTKIATVIRADLPRLAHLRPGGDLRFAAVTRAQALQAWHEQRQALAHWCTTIESHRPPGALDLDALNRTNLVSGVIDAARDALPWE